MDGDRPVADGRDIFESKLQELIREAFEEGWEFGDDDLPDPSCCGYAEEKEAYEKYNKKLHELLISYFDGEASYVGPQDEAPETGEMGDGVRQEPDIDFVFRGAREQPIGHCDLTINPDGSVTATIKFYRTEVEKLEKQALKQFEDELIYGRPRNSSPQNPR